jgi:hypothetical protein
MQWMQQEAARYNMKIGLKNALDIVNNVASFVDFAVNEQCAQLGECQLYQQFLALNKPVFHIEYPTPLDVNAAKGISCTGSGVDNTSTILKDLTLNGITYYCDGSYVNVPTVGGTSPPRPSRSPKPPQSSRPSQTPNPSPTSRPSQAPPSSSRPGQSPRPTSSPQAPPPRPSTTLRPSPTSAPGGGCRSKHWDQCGGQDWKGCTVCEVCVYFGDIETGANNMMCNRPGLHVRACRRRTITSACSRSFPECLMFYIDKSTIILLTSLIILTVLSHSVRTLQARVQALIIHTHLTRDTLLPPASLSTTESYLIH